MRLPACSEEGKICSPLYAITDTALTQKRLARPCGLCNAGPANEVKVIPIDGRQGPSVNQRKCKGVQRVKLLDRVCPNAQSVAERDERAFGPRQRAKRVSEFSIFTGVDVYPEMVSSSCSIGRACDAQTLTSALKVGSHGLPELSKSALASAAQADALATQVDT